MGVIVNRRRVMGGVAAPPIEWDKDSSLIRCSTLTIHWMVAQRG